MSSGKSKSAAKSKPAGNSKKVISSVLGLVVVAAAVYSVVFMDWEKAPPEEEEIVRPLKTVVVQGGQSHRTYRYLGVIEAADEVALSFDVSGALMALDVKKGDRVVKDQVLASLDARDFENALASAQADADKARVTLERLRPAAGTGAISKQQLTDAEAAAASSAARLSIQQKALADTKLMASFDGVVADVLVDNYQNITAKQTILVLQATDDVDVTVDVPEARMADVDPKRARTEPLASSFAMTLDYFPDRRFTVLPKEFSTQADQLTLSYKVTFTMPRPDDVTLLPGMPATITETKPVEIKGTQGFLLPADAVPVDTAGKYFVWSLKEAQKDIFTVQRKVVDIGEMLDDRIVVTQGVAEGERIAAAGVHILKGFPWGMLCRRER
jgi:RND family efflux transporter MFP subunit